MWRCDCPPQSCESLVCRHRAGETAAGEALVTKFAPLIRGIVRHVSRYSGPDQRQDMAQEIFLHLFSKLDRWDRSRPFCRWAAVVAVRRAIDLNRPRRQPVQLGDQAIEPYTDDSSSSWLELRADHALSELPREWQQAYKLSLQGHSHDEVARKLHKSVRTVRYWLAGVRRALLQCMDG